MAVYAPTDRGENEDFWKKVKKKIQESRSIFPKPNILLGDFNMVEDAIDRFPARLRDIDSPESFAELKRYLKLEDGWRETFPHTKEWTWRNAARSAMSRIDRIYLTKALNTASREWAVKLSGLNMNDHSRVLVEVANLDAPEIGMGRWMMSAECARDNRLLVAINDLARDAELEIETIKAHGRSQELNAQRTWAQFKTKLVREAKKRSREINCAKKKDEERLEGLRQAAKQEYLEAEEVLEREKARQALRAAETTLSRAQEIAHKDKFERRDARIWADAETMKKSWFRWTKENKPRDTIAALARPNSNPKTFSSDSQEMADAAGAYHESIQNKDLEVDPDERQRACETVLGHVPRKMNEDGKKEAAQLIARGNIVESLLSAKNGSAAGLDGIVYELWKELHRRYETPPGPNQRMSIPRKPPEKEVKWVDIVGMMTDVFQDIEEYGVDDSTGTQDSLEKWSTHHPTMNGKAILSRVIAGGHTQFLTAAQGMPRSVEKRLDSIVMDFIWDSPGRHPVNMATLRRPRDDGGLELFCAGERNDAQYITWLATYLAPLGRRPLWAYIADQLYRRAIIGKDSRRVPVGQRINPFCQAWRPNLRKLPFILRQMITVSRKYGLAIDAPYIPENIRIGIPVWAHPAMLNPNARNRRPWTSRCLKFHHAVETVEDLEEIAEWDEGDHEADSDCACENCITDRAEGCRHPYRCQEMASEILGSISGKWNPAVTKDEEPRDVWDAFADSRATALEVGETMVFERDTVRPTKVEDMLRIFVNEIGLDPGPAHDIMRREMGERPARKEPRQSIHVIVCAGMTMDSSEDARGGYTVVFPDKEYEDIDRACAGPEQTYAQALALGILAAARAVPNSDDLHVILTSRMMIWRNTSDLDGLESRRDKWN
ncbi:hypothetical protein AURDEDRAFT_130493 [Auricularia subglabra TFB-10046 SS5]|uniref:Endonuclease/exonuclease/phosphatase domain-containing protein n=1 Tax=Auricularia subglabra (strain TFB-10046 / SS5) TaxID=717982 RepID=J0D8J3_AURST|nr:hypothetical protein AURDEDRAFT_130493 [Auricularia subglabra TFB-10046 SS5]